MYGKLIVSMMQSILSQQIWFVITFNHKKLNCIYLIVVLTILNIWFIKHHCTWKILCLFLEELLVLWIKKASVLSKENRMV